ncbi:MAG: response regulator [Phycisphaerae bacterium]|nr:response regulator [Phycisphaerae bacterium]MDW8261160.1 response regulator [Phycisphaerales bacterium]
MHDDRTENGSLLRSADGEPITILLVDDDPDCRMLVRDAIAECKVANAVYEVANGQEALDFIHRRGRFHDAPRPGLIFLDIEMPVMGGLTALRQIKSDPALRDIPVVVMTGVCGEKEMAEAAAAGANSYTLKPANAEQFLKTVMASTSYWLEVHQYPRHHWPAEVCRR